LIELLVLLDDLSGDAETEGDDDRPDGPDGDEESTDGTELTEDRYDVVEHQRSVP